MWLSVLWAGTLMKKLQGKFLDFPELTEILVLET